MITVHRRVLMRDWYTLAKHADEEGCQTAEDKMQPLGSRRCGVVATQMRRNSYYPVIESSTSIRT